MTLFRLFKLLSNDVQSGLFFFSFFFQKMKGRERRREKRNRNIKKKREGIQNRLWV